MDLGLNFGLAAFHECDLKQVNYPLNASFDKNRRKIITEVLEEFSEIIHLTTQAYR